MRCMRVAVIALVVLLIAGCQSTTTPSPAPNATGSSPTGVGTSGTSGPSTPRPIKEGGVLIFGLDGEMSYADAAIGQDQNQFYVLTQVLQGLVGLKPGTINDIQPVLAASLPTVSPDGLTYTFALRTGVKFHDGTAFDSAAVKYNYERQRNFPKGALQSNDYYYGAVFGGFGADSNISAIDTPNASTVVFHLKVPQANFLITQTIPPFFIQSPTALEQNGANNPQLDQNPYAQGKGGRGKSMVGTGPFMFDEWVANDHVNLVKNPSYWDPASAAHLDKVVFRPLKSGTAKLQAIQSGDIDIAETIIPTDVATAKSANLQVLDRGQSCNIAILGMNQDATTPGIYDVASHTLMQNKAIRMAIAYALNKPAYISAFYAGLAKVADNWMPPAAQYYKALNLPTYNVQKAKDLIAQSAVPAAKLVMDFYYPSDVSSPTAPDPKGLAQAIAADLEAVGFKINIKTEGWSTGYRTDYHAGKFPLWISGWNCDWAGPDNFLQTAFFHYTGSTPSKDFAYRNDQLNTTMNQALQAPSSTQAQSLWQSAQDLIAADMPTVPLLHSTPPGALASYVRGFQGAGNLGEFLYTVWLDK
jgi:peptide/nickel transport system substrate-binding protein